MKGSCMMPPVYWPHAPSELKVHAMTRSMILAAVAMPVLSSASFAADLDAGKAAADRQCLECHEAADWQGEDAASLESLIRDIVAGKIKHKRTLQLADNDIRNIAAYWASGGKKK